MIVNCFTKPRVYKNLTYRQFVRYCDFPSRFITGNGIFENNVCHITVIRDCLQDAYATSSDGNFIRSKAIIWVL